MCCYKAAPRLYYLVLCVSKRFVQMKVYSYIKRLVKSNLSEFVKQKVSLSSGFNLIMLHWKAYF